MLLRFWRLDSQWWRLIGRASWRSFLFMWLSLCSSCMHHSLLLPHSKLSLIPLIRNAESDFIFISCRSNHILSWAGRFFKDVFTKVKSQYCRWCRCLKSSQTFWYYQSLAYRYNFSKYRSPNSASHFSLNSFRATLLYNLLKRCYSGRAFSNHWVKLYLEESNNSNHLSYLLMLPPSQARTCYKCVGRLLDAFEQAIWIY